MGEQQLFFPLLLAWLALAPGIAVTLLFIRAPYGRYTRTGWGPALASRWGWLLMELPSAILFAALFAIGSRHASVVALTFLCMWEFHYLYRSLVFPTRLRGTTRHMPASVIAMGIAFNTCNCYFNGRYLFGLGPVRGVAWFGDPRFVLGTLLFFAGFAVHASADASLQKIRPRGTDSYAIPNGGLYRWISCPNYFGEILQWCGWALATWSLPGVAFALWTVANLGPRARSHHRWYRERFPEYPQNRKALVPGLW